MEVKLPAHLESCQTDQQALGNPTQRSEVPKKNESDGFKNTLSDIMNNVQQMHKIHI